MSELSSGLEYLQYNPEIIKSFKVIAVPEDKIMRIRMKKNFVPKYSYLGFADISQGEFGLDPVEKIRFVRAKA